MHTYTVHYHLPGDADRIYSFIVENVATGEVANRVAKELLGDDIIILCTNRHGA